MRGIEFVKISSKEHSIYFIFRPILAYRFAVVISEAERNMKLKLKEFQEKGVDFKTIETIKSSLTSKFEFDK